MFAAREKDVQNRALEIDEVRLVADLRIMHSKVDELYQVVKSLREHHDETRSSTTPIRRCSARTSARSTRSTCGS